MHLDADLGTIISQRVLGLCRVRSRVTDDEVERLTGHGIDVLKLRPYPVRSLPEHVVEAAQQAALEPHTTSSRGLFELRAAIAQSLSNELGISLDPESHILITNGGMQALHVVLSSLLDVGDELLIPSPCFFLEGLVALARGRAVYVPMSEQDDYRWDMTRLEGMITKRTKAVFVNTPVNPTGYVLSRKDLETLAELSQRYNLTVLSDESYDRLVYDGLRHESIASIPDVRKHTILVRSFTKSYAMPSWRIGYIVADSKIIEQLTKVFEWMNLFCSYVPQKAAAAAIGGPQDWLADVVADFQSNRDLLCAGIHSVDGLRCVKPRGGPFLFVNISRSSLPSEDFSSRLLSQFGVPTVPGLALQSDNHVRMAFGATHLTLERAVEALGCLMKAVANGHQDDSGVCSKG